MTNVAKHDITPKVTKASQERKAVNSKIKGVDVDTSRFVWHEVPGVDGTRKILTITNPYVSGLIEIYRDGVMLKKTIDYTETDPTTVTLVSALESVEGFWVNYIKQ